MPFEPVPFVSSCPLLEELVAPPPFGAAEPATNPPWTPLLSATCGFGLDEFRRVMMNFIRNPNLNTSWLFRADIIADHEWDDASDTNTVAPPLGVPEQARLLAFAGFQVERVLVRTMVPRNTRRDRPMDQTCAFYRSSHLPPAINSSELTQPLLSSLVVYVPHAQPSDIPFYHPRVRGIAHLHQWNAEANCGIISVHYCFANGIDTAERKKLHRTALMLLSHLWKHGQGAVKGYTKRVHHDVLISQSMLQDRYAALKHKYSRHLVQTWAETTDPLKHVFEDLGIAAFLIELWTEMYTKQDKPFPGFVDVGCGNGLLVYLLRREGFSGWGFDARERKSWAAYKETYIDGTAAVQSLRVHVLLPAAVACDKPLPESVPPGLLHDGLFPPGTFIVSNHADELTPWTPLVAVASDCPFLSIPCCSHNLAGSKFRAPRPRSNAVSQSSSTYASLVDWVARIAEDCGFIVETEMLRIPTTRNTGLVGRRRTKPASEVDVNEIINRYGGCSGYLNNVLSLISSGPRRH